MQNRIPHRSHISSASRFGGGPAGKLPEIRNWNQQGSGIPTRIDDRINAKSADCFAKAALLQFWARSLQPSDPKLILP